MSVQACGNDLKQQWDRAEGVEYHGRNNARTADTLQYCVCGGEEGRRGGGGGFQDRDGNVRP